ncbi:hypothetical protein EZS27_019575 [termite gut metagenome]|uniref:Uncharacterized protein n=1 Tax=termite gut metagenome TaxID=433724 RepID=A0A5J4RCQ7_9ZZZZ
MEKNEECIVYANYPCVRDISGNLFCEGTNKKDWNG